MRARMSSAFAVFCGRPGRLGLRARTRSDRTIVSMTSTLSGEADTPLSRIIAPPAQVVSHLRNTADFQGMPHAQARKFPHQANSVIAFSPDTDDLCRTPRPF